MPKFCEDRKCEFYEEHPDGTADRFKWCSFCGTTLVTEKPSQTSSKPSHTGTNPQHTVSNPQSIDTNLQSTNTNPQSTVTNLQPTDTNLQPTDTNLQPTDTNLQPTDTNLQPTDTNLQSTVTNLQSIDTNPQSIDTNLQSTDTNPQSTVTNLQPTVTNPQPTDTNLQSIDTNLQPTDTNLQSIDTNLQPTDTNLQSIDTNPQPTVTNPQPTDTNLQSIDTNLQSIDNLQPTDTNLQSTYTNLQFIDTNLQPTDTNLQSIDNLQPTDTNLQPTDTNLQSIDNLQPTDTNLQSIDTNLQPTDTNLQSIDTNPQPTVTNPQPTDTNLQSIDTNLQSIDNLQPTDTNLQSTYTNLQFIDTNLQPTDTNLQSIDNLQPTDTNLQPTDTNLQSTDTNLQSTDTNPQSTDTNPQHPGTDPQPTEQSIEDFVDVTNEIFTPKFNLFSRHDKKFESMHGSEFETVNLTFNTVILLKHFLQHKGCISLRFKSSQSGFERCDFKGFDKVEYEGHVFVFLNLTIKINSSALTASGAQNSELLVPYKYYLSDSEEKLYLKEGDCFRNLIIDQFIFYSNNIQVYDMIILPDELPPEDSYLKRIETRLSIISNLYAPKGDMLANIPLNTIRGQVQAILFSLCNGYYSKISNWKKRKNFQLFNSQQIHDVFSEMLKDWLVQVMKTSFPFPLKFLLLFSTFDDEHVQAYSTELFCLLFQEVNYDFILTLINPLHGVFTDYRDDIVSRPFLLHNAMLGISNKEFGQLIKFLPLYHALFESEESFTRAHSDQAFLDNSYWGLPSYVHFQHYDAVSLSVIVDAMSTFRNSDPLLPYSIILLTLRPEIFLSLLDTLRVPFLPFFSILLYRVKTWSLLKQDCQLREIVFSTFLEKSKEFPGFMNNDHICQAIEVIFMMLDVVKASPVTPNGKFNLKQALSVLHVLAELMELVDNNYLKQSLEYFHPDNAGITSLKPASDLLSTIGECLHKAILQPSYRSEYAPLDEVANVWCALSSLPFPKSYNWTSEVSNQLSKRLRRMEMGSVLTTFVTLCNRYNEMNLIESIVNCFCVEILEILETSGTIEIDQKIIIQEIVQISKERFYIVADIINYILVSNSDQLHKDPVNHILTLPWCHFLVKYCEPNELEQYSTEAETLMELMRNTFSQLALDYHNLTIKTKHLTLVIGYQDNYYSLLRSVPKANPQIFKQLDRPIFDKSITYRKGIADTFLEFRAGLHDLKKLLDSTNTLIHSQELDKLLDFDYLSSPISALCCISEDSKICLMPDWENSQKLNDRMFNLMLKSLPFLLKSQYFLAVFKQKVEKSTEFENNLPEIHALFVGAFNTIRKTIRDLFDMNILISNVYTHFEIYSQTNTDLIDKEIDHLVTAIEIVNQQPCYNKENSSESMEKVKLCIKLKQRQKITETIIRVKNKYCMDGDFTKIYFLNSLNDEAKELHSLTTEMSEISDQLFAFNDLDQHILDILLTCANLFIWASTILKTSSDLDNLTELALNSINNFPLEVSHVSSFKTVCRLFSPFIYGQSQKVDQDEFLSRLSKVHFNIESPGNDTCRLLEISQDCAKEVHIKFWQTLELKHISIGGNTLTQLKEILSDGKFILNIKESSCSVEDIISVQIPQTYGVGTYSLHDLKEMQSEVVLISSEMHEDSIGARFQNLLEVISQLSEIALKFHLSGNALFRNQNLSYSCNSPKIMSEDSRFLDEQCRNWISSLGEARQKYYYLNYFTSAQILTIQIELEKLGRFPSKVMDKQTFYLLTFLSEYLGEEDVRNALYRIGVGTSPVDSLDSLASVDNNSLTRSYGKSMSTSSLESSYLHLSPTDLDNPFNIMPQEFGLMSPSDTDCSFDVVATIHISESQLRGMYKNQPEFTSLAKLDSFFRILSPKDKTPRSFSMTSEEPNLIFVPNYHIMNAILSLYYSPEHSELPHPHEVLICSEKTTLEEIELFWRRSLTDCVYSSYYIFCLAQIEKLNYDTAVKSVSILKMFIHPVDRKRTEFRLVLICSEEHKHSSYMASALARYERVSQIQTVEKLKSFVYKNISVCTTDLSHKSDHFPIKPISFVDPDQCRVRIVSSHSPGDGKSLTISRLVETLKERSGYNDPHFSPCTIVSLYEGEGCEDKAVNKLLASPVSAGEYGRIYHFDVISSSDKNLASFLFKLLVMRTICDSSGRIFRCSKNNLYIVEISLASELELFLNIFPVWSCMGPRGAIRLEKGNKDSKKFQLTLCDSIEFESETFQRVFAYLGKLESGADIDKYTYVHMHDLKRKCESRLDLLLKYYGQEKPSWSELKHFISFFNKQLIACEKNIYCQSIKVDKSWIGFKKFLVECLILMAKDFTTPSLRNLLQSPPIDAVAGYDIDQKRKWGQKNYPNIYMNEDLQSMTFFGISISEDLSKLDSFDSNKIIAERVIRKRLYLTLKENKVDLEEDFHNWDRKKMISILVNVLGIPWKAGDTPPPDPDPNYVLTVDNVKKILAIHMRFRCNIPVVLMGETGCGKTRLIQFMCKLQVNSPDIQNLVILKVHGEITEFDIKDSYRTALELAQQNSANNIDTVLFFDEANTSYSIGLIKEILCDRRVDGLPIPENLRLQFVVACNPYRKHSVEMLTKLTSAGLGMLASNDQAREHFVDIPLRELVYRVIPLPASLLPLVWDFGNLDSESEKSYIENIVDTYLKIDNFAQLIHCSGVISNALYHSQVYMRNRTDECSFVSLRDVVRAVQVMLWFYQLLPSLQIPNMKLDRITYSLILSLAVCYRAKLKDREDFDRSITAEVEYLGSKITETNLITKEIDKFQDVIISMMTIGEHIARNKALKENLFMMFVCIQLKIPIFIIGKPGTSKSLAKSILSHSMNGDLALHGEKVSGLKFTHIHMQSYQCSQLTTSDEIKSQFKKCQIIQSENDSSSVACVVLDEVGLAEDSPNLPLKILHSLLEDEMDSKAGVAFVGLSNWALDPAKMNRGIMLYLEDPTTEELVNTAHSIIKPCEDKHDTISLLLSPYIKSLAEGYLKLMKIKLERTTNDYFGLRDFYHLIKMLYLLCEEFGDTLNKKIMTHAIKKNFGGITDINVIEIFSECLNIPKEGDSEKGPLSDPLSLISYNLEPKSTGGDPYLRSRYLLLLTENYAALDILFNSRLLKENAKVIFGSSFPHDQDYFSICHNINRIKVFMETGKIVVLTNLSNVYESLYEMLNQFYVELFGKSWVGIGIGSRLIKCAVHPNFRLIVVANRTTVYEKFPPPLINRLEKHILTVSTLIREDVMVNDIIDKLTNWLQSTLDVTLLKDAIPLIVYSMINKLGLKGREREWEETILKHTKFELLKLVSPNYILRLPKSSLTSEASEIYQNYCKLKLFSLVDYLLALPNIRKEFNAQRREISLGISEVLKDDEIKHFPQPIFNSSADDNSPFLSFVTTHSNLLTEIDISEIESRLTSCFKKRPNISILNLSQFKAEIEFISAISHDIATQLEEDEKKIILIQCEENVKNSDLISCAKYRVIEFTKGINSNLNSNFYFIFIIKMELTNPGSGCSSFCGEPWDSVYIDELRESLHNLLPPFEQITQLSVAQIFDYQHQDISDLTSKSFRGDRYHFQKRRLRRCVQKAVSRIFDPSERSNDRNATRITKLARLLSHPELADLTCDKISNLLKQITSTKYGTEWAYTKALESDCSTANSNFMKVLSLHIDDLIVPLLGGILAILDTHNNLDLAFDTKQTNIKTLWECFYQDGTIINMSSLITERSLSSQFSILNHSKNVIIVQNCFPFFQIIYQQVNHLFRHMCTNVGVNDTLEMFEDNFMQSYIGKAVSSVKINTKNLLTIHEAYLRDFSIYHMTSSVDKSSHLFRTICIMLSVAASEHRKARRDDVVVEDKGSHLMLPDVTIPSIHIAYHLIRKRIIFVNEAFTLGVNFPKDHKILLEDWFQNPKTYLALKNIDFDIFKLIIEYCWSKVSYIKQCVEFQKEVMEYRSFVDRVSNYRCLIEENWSLFCEEYNKEMVPLRAKWQAARCLAIFVTRFLNEYLLKEINLKVNSTLILQALRRMCIIISKQDVDFQSSRTVQSILEMLKIFTSVSSTEIIHVCQHDENTELSSIGIVNCSCVPKLLDFFQDLSARFFLRMLLNISFSNSLAQIPGNLKDYLIDILLKNQNMSDARPSPPFYLYRDGEINPSPALRCVLLGFMLKDRSELTREKIAEKMQIILKPKEYSRGDNPAFLFLQSLEDSFHHTTSKTKKSIENSLSRIDVKLFPIFSSEVLTFKMIESVAAVRFSIHWIIRWKTASYLRRVYLRSQKDCFKLENEPQYEIPIERSDLNELISQIQTIRGKDQDIQTFLSKTFYFRIGYGGLIKYQKFKDMSWVFPQNYASMKGKGSCYLDLFYGVDSSYVTIKELLFAEGSSKTLTRSAHGIKKKTGEKRFQQNTIFALFSVCMPYHLGIPEDVNQDVLSQGLPSERIHILKEQICATMPKEPIDFNALADEILENKLFNLPQLKISANTHLNNVFIAGLLCHIGVFLQFTRNNLFFKPLTEIHYNPTHLHNHFFPAICEEDYHPTTSVTKTTPFAITSLNIPSESNAKNVQQIRSGSEPDSTSSQTQGFVHSKMVTLSPIYSHVLGNPFCRASTPNGIRNLAAISVALIRSLMHGIFIWTLHTQHMTCPSDVVKLVEPISSKNTCSEYFYHHLVQDIIDITIVSNKTFEEAILYVHLLIDQMIHQKALSTTRIDPHTTPTELMTSTDREEWEYSFEKYYIKQFQESNEKLLSEKMRTIISKSDNCDKELLKLFYEEEKQTGVHSLLWKHRSIIGHEHLLQVFNSQSLHTFAKYPLLEKFLKEETFLSTTKYLPDFVSLRCKLIQAKYYNKMRISELTIGEFIKFIEKEETTDSGNVYKQLFNSLEIIWSKLNRNIEILLSHYQKKTSFEYQRTLIGELVGVGVNQGLLAGLISVLVGIHNAFIKTYNRVFCISSRAERRVPVSVVSHSHMIDYENHLESLIFSNATYSFQMGEGTDIRYDFSGIQNDLGTRFMFSKPYITFDELDLGYPEHAYMIDYFKRLKLKIPQEELASDWEVIREELRSPHEITEVISLIEMVLNFVSSADGCSPNTKIRSYLHGVLKYPKKKNLISERANEVCCLKHLSSLWHNLSIHRAKRLASHRQSPFPFISPKYSEHLEDSDIPRLMENITKADIDWILVLIHDFIMFNLNVADLAVYSCCNLRESLVTFSKGEKVFISSKDEPNCEIIPNEFFVSQTVSVWTHLVVEAKKRFR